MTPDAPVSTALPDLRVIRLDDLAALTPAALDDVVQRVLPGRPVQTVQTRGFSSAF